MHLDETIAAIATAPGGAARGIVRLSGPNVLACLGRLFPGESHESLRRTTAAAVISTSLPLPDLAAVPLPCEIYFWPNSRSYTRQCVAEIHTLGSPPLLAKLLNMICAAGARPATPGEFTLRAFLAGRIDLTQAEAVLGVIDAQGDGELQNALSQLAGGMAEPLHKLRSKLLDVLAHLEAGLDFVEEDIEFITVAELDASLSAAENRVAELLNKMNARSEVRETVRIVLIGRPNAGKSSLFNALLHQLSAKSSKAAYAAALVSTEAGTTRDYLSAKLTLADVSCELVDTAGVDESLSQDEVARAAQEFTNTKQSMAQIKLICLDANETPNAWEQSLLREHLANTNDLSDGAAESPATSLSTLLVWTKCDSSERPAPYKVPRAVCTSSLTGLGLTELLERLASLAIEQSGASAESVSSTVVRCRESLRQAAAALKAARELALSKGGEELVALEVRSALEGLGSVAGAIYTDDVLDRVFSRFCIGK